MSIAGKTADIVILPSVWNEDAIQRFAKILPGEQLEQDYLDLFGRFAELNDMFLREADTIYVISRQMAGGELGELLKQLDELKDAMKRLMEVF